MLNILLPTDSAFFDQRLDLDGTTYIIELFWNARGGESGTWLLSVKAEDGTPLASGVTVVSDRLLLKRYKYDTRMPAGDFIAVDLTRTIPAPGYTQLGDTVPLYYIEAAELAGA